MLSITGVTADTTDIVSAVMMSVTLSNGLQLLRGLEQSEVSEQL
jgi:hypothetical protein